MLLLWLALFQDTGEEVFRRFEKKWADATALTLSFRGEARDGSDKVTFTGSLEIEREKYVLKVGHNLNGRDRIEELETNPRVPVLYHRRAVTRTGFFLESQVLPPLLQGREAAEDPFPVSDIAVARENGETALTYVVKVDGESWKVRLWIDTESLVPLRRTITGPDLTILETYSDVAVRRQP